MRSRRVARCTGCGLPASLCLCSELPRLRVQTRVIVVMNRFEAVRPSNTGRLAAAMLERSVLQVGVLPDSLAAGCAVLFPFPGAPILRERPAALLVPDGSWSQARSMAIKAVRELGATAVTLPPGEPGMQGLRKRPSAEHLCTFEAIARALSILEGDWVGAKMMPVLETFFERARMVRR